MAGNLFVVDALEIKWGKSLMQMPFLTIKEIEAHHQNSGKDHGGPILKTLERGHRHTDRDTHTHRDTLTLGLYGKLHVFNNLNFLWFKMKLANLCCRLNLKRVVTSFPTKLFDGRNPLLT